MKAYFNAGHTAFYCTVVGCGIGRNMGKMIIIDKYGQEGYCSPDNLSYDSIIGLSTF